MIVNQPEIKDTPLGVFSMCAATVALMDDVDVDLSQIDIRVTVNGHDVDIRRAIAMWSAAPVAARKVEEGEAEAYQRRRESWANRVVILTSMVGGFGDDLVARCRRQVIGAAPALLFHSSMQGAAVDHLLDSVPNVTAHTLFTNPPYVEYANNLIRDIDADNA